MFFLVLASTLLGTQATVPKDFLEGFLTGVQGTEVVLSDECLDPAWAVQTNAVFSKFIKALHKKDWLQIFFKGKTLLELAAAEFYDCHTPEVFEVLELLFAVPLNKQFFNALGNYPELSIAVETALITTDPWIAGKASGEAVRIILNGSRHPTLLPSDAAATATQSFIEELAGDNKPLVCEKDLPNVSLVVKSFIDVLNKVISRKSTMNDLVGELAKGYLVWEDVSASCELELIVQHVKELATEQGASKAFVNYAFHKAKILQLIQDIYSAGPQDIGKDCAKIVKLILGI